MARMIDTATASQLFDDIVQSELQNMEALDGTCRTYDTSGEAFNIPYFDQLVMNKSDFGAGDIPVVDVAQRNVQIIQDNYNLKTTIGYANETRFAYDVVAGHARQHALAIARFNDNLKIQALVAADAQFTVGNNNLITATGGFLVKNLTDARFKIFQNGGGMSKLSCYTSGFNGPAFFNDNDFKSWDFNADRPLMNGGKIGMFSGVDIRLLGEASPENSLPSTTGPLTSSTYVVEYEALAVAYNRRPKSVIVAEPGQDRTCILSTGTAGAVVTLPKAIVKLDVTVDIPVA